MSYHDSNLQDVIWQLADPWGWRLYAVLSGLMALVLFRHLLRTHERNALTLGRLAWMGAGILGMFVRLNSAIEFVSPMMFVAGGLWMAVLIEVNWCGRRGTVRQKVWAIIGEQRKVAHKVHYPMGD